VYTLFTVTASDDKGWGEIDLLGIAADGLPVVIEIEKRDSTETPASVLVQAAAYGLALQRAWWFLRGDWIKQGDRRK
jgi:hypothetical protein